MANHSLQRSRISAKNADTARRLFGLECRLASSGPRQDVRRRNRKFSEGLDVSAKIILHRESTWSACNPRSNIWPHNQSERTTSPILVVLHKFQTSNLAPLILQMPIEPRQRSLNHVPLVFRLHKHMSLVFINH